MKRDTISLRLTKEEARTLVDLVSYEKEKTEATTVILKGDRELGKRLGDLQKIEGKLQAV